jgi:hypothetical protein
LIVTCFDDSGEPDDVLLDADNVSEVDLHQLLEPVIKHVDAVHFDHDVRQWTS